MTKVADPFDDTPRLGDEGASETRAVPVVPPGLRTGDLVGGYRLVAELGRGGMGIVFRAADEALGRHVALKLVAPAHTSDRTLRERFRREARLAAELEHPNVVPIYRVGQDRGRLFVAMRLVDGDDLDAAVRSEGALGVERSVSIVEQVAAALDAAHARGLVHRDVKPANVLLEGSQAFLTDFGLALRPGVDQALTATGAWLGTAAYGAPEQFRGRPLDPRADVYALGGVLHYCLTGRAPYPFVSQAEAVAAHLSSPPPRPSDADAGLQAFDAVLQRAMSKRPDERFRSAGELAEAARRAVRLAPAGPPRRVAPPRTSTDLVGREAEIEAVCELVLANRGRLVTLIGPGGIGKTRIALAVAERLRTRFSAGAFVVRLEAVQDPSQAMSAVARAVGAAAAPGEDPMGGLLRFLEGRKLLIVMDNFEHVVEAAGAVAELVAHSPGTVVLVTSRAPLRVDAERLFTVSGMRLEGRPSEATQLFALRAARANPGFELTAANAGAVASVCAALEGVPLAVELAAARMRYITVEELVPRLEHRLAVLGRGGPDRPARHRSLRAAIDSSFDMLDRPVQTLLARLGVFVSGFTLEAAEGVCGDGLDVLDGLEQLLDNSLVCRDDGFGPARYRLLHTIREYAREQLAASEETERFAANHAGYFAALAERLASHLYAADPQAMARLDADYGNMRAALEHARRAGDPETLLRIAIALRMYWYFRGLIREGVAWLDAGLGLGPVARHTRAWALTASGGLRASLTAEEAQARDHLDAAAHLASDLDDPLLEFDLLLAMSLLVDSGPEAWDVHTRTVGTARSVGDPRRVALALSNLADLALREGDADAAARHAGEALELLGEGTDVATRSLALLNLATARFLSGSWGEAASHTWEALSLAASVGDRIDIAAGLVLIGAIGSASAPGPDAALVLFAGEAQYDERAGFLQPVEERLFAEAVQRLAVTLGDVELERARADAREMEPTAALRLAQVVAERLTTDVT